jgi:enamine deaminase RidA (YjgF/YER057c/UK114 family)
LIDEKVAEIGIGILIATSTLGCENQMSNNIENQNVELNRTEKMNIEPKINLTQLGLELPNVSTPGGNYVSVNIRENIAYVAIQFPIRNEEYLHQGRLGKEITTEQGYKAMELCTLNVLSQMDKKVGFDKIIGLNHIDAYFQSGDDWDESPKVVNGASDLFVKVLEEKGRHSRSIFGVEKLPRNFSVGLTASFTIEKE